MIVYKHDDCLLKDNGFNHPERKERIISILTSIKKIKEQVNKVQNVLNKLKINGSSSELASLSLNKFL